MSDSSAKRPYHHGNLRHALVTAGRRLLEEKGFRGFTLRECARRAGVSHAAPAHHFASLDDLLGELAVQGFAELLAAMQAEAGRGGGDARRRLLGLGAGYMAFAAGNPFLFQLMFAREANGLSGELTAPGVEAVHRCCRDAVADLLPQAPEAAIQRMTDLYWSAAHGFIALLLDAQIGGQDTSQRLRERGVAVLEAAVATVIAAAPRS